MEKCEYCSICGYGLPRNYLNEEIEIKSINSDVLIEMLEKIGRLNASMVIEATHRTNKKVFSDKQTEQVHHILSVIASYVYDELKITKEQLHEGNKIMEDIMFDVGR